MGMVDEVYLKRIWKAYIERLDAKRYRDANRLRKLYYKALAAFYAKSEYYARLK
jgi:hypothetical protein